MQSLIAMRTKSTDAKHKENIQAITSISLQHFTDFFTCKAFDVIGGGTYKPYIIKCKENNDQWAVNIHFSNNVILDAIKSVIILLQQTQTLPNTRLNMILKEIVNNTTPPICVVLNWGVCHISGEHSKHCVKLIRHNTRLAETVCMQKKYFQFIKMLWYICKLEHIIRTITRHWIEQNSHTLKNLNTMEQCELFQKTFHNIEKHYFYFGKALNHVTKSFEAYIQHYVFEIPLQLDFDVKNISKKVVR